MPDDKPLPNPHKRPWDRAEPEGELLADRMARAIAENRVDEFVEEEFEGNENARKLAEFMMQMTGMGPMPPGAPPGGYGAASEPVESRNEDASAAAKNAEPEAAADDTSESESSGEQPSADAGASGVPDELAKIAAENGVEVQWVISRALSLYIRDYRATGRL